MDWFRKTSWQCQQLDISRFLSVLGILAKVVIDGGVCTKSPNILILHICGGSTVSSLQLTRWPLWRCGSNFKRLISEHMLWIKFMSTSCVITLMWIPQNTFDYQSVNNGSGDGHQATSFYLSQCWPRCMSSFGFTLLMHWRYCSLVLSHGYVHYYNYNTEHQWNLELSEMTKITLKCRLYYMYWIRIVILMISPSLAVMGVVITTSALSDNEYFSLIKFQFHRNQWWKFHENDISF